MTEYPLPALLLSVLQPLSSILVKVNRAAIIARAKRTPEISIQTITAARDLIDSSYELVHQTVVALNPNHHKPERTLPMSKHTIHAQLRDAQDILNHLNQLLESTRELARHNNLAPIHIDAISRSIDANQTVWNDLYMVATRLELTAGPFKRSTRPHVEPIEL